MRNHLACLGLVCSGLLANSALAFEVEHEAHVHGHASLTVVQDKNELQLVFTSPAMDMVGFEHQPKSKDQHASIERAKDILSHANDLFVINEEAKCTLEHTKISSALLENKDHHEHATHEEHDHHANKDHHDDHGEHKEHGHHHDEHKHHEDHHDEHKHHDEETHSEFEAEYHFECTSIAFLKEIKVSLFESFNSLKEVEAKIVTHKGQSLIELNRNQETITF